MGRMPSDSNPPGQMSARFVSLSADSADPPGLNDYDSFAEGYTASNETSFVHAYYERPAVLALAGDVAGRRIVNPEVNFADETAPAAEAGASYAGVIGGPAWNGLVLTLDLPHRRMWLR